MTGKGDFSRLRSSVATFEHPDLVPGVEKMWQSHSESINSSTLGSVQGFHIVTA